MKKGKLLLLMLLCCMLTACKDDQPNIEATETEIEGVEIVDAVFKYSYEEQAGGNLLFSIEGEWGKNLSWALETEGDKVATAKELSQNTKVAKYQFSPTNKKGGYSDFEIVLRDTATKEIKYSAVVSLILSEDGKSLSFLNVYFEESIEESEDTQTTENTEPTEELSSEQQEIIQEEEKSFHKLVGELTLPKEFTSCYKKTTKDMINGKEIELAYISLEYKEKSYICIVSKDLSFSDFLKEEKIDENLKQTKEVNKVEVSVYEGYDSRYVMWKNSDGLRYIVTEKKITDDTLFEVVGLLIK